MSISTKNMDPQKLEAKENLVRAIEWKKEESVNEKSVTTARIFKVKPDSISQSIKWASTRTQNQKGSYNTYGSNNKVLLEAQKEAIH